MDYRDFAKDLLKRKNQLTVARKSIKQQIEELEREKYSCKTASLNAKPVTSSGTNKYEDRLITVIALLDDCRFRSKVVERELKMIESGFSDLDDYQVQLLEGFFIHNTKGRQKQGFGKVHPFCLRYCVDLMPDINEYPYHIFYSAPSYPFIPQKRDAQTTSVRPGQFFAI